MGYTFEVGPECEFFLFNTDENTMPTTNTHEQAGYFDIGPLDFGENARRDIVMNLEDMGFVIELPITRWLRPSMRLISDTMRH